MRFGNSRCAPIPPRSRAQPGQAGGAARRLRRRGRRLRALLHDERLERLVAPPVSRERLPLEPAVRVGPQRLMVQVREVVDVDVVLDEELPIAGDGVLDLGSLDERPVPATGEEVLEAPVEPAQGLGQAPGIVGGVDHDHAVPFGDGGGTESPRSPVEVAKLLLLLGDPHQRAVDAEAPLVVRTGDDAPQLARPLEQRQAAMAAQVVVGAERPVATPQHDEGHPPDRLGEVAPRTQLVSRGDQRPGAGEEPPSLELEELRGAVELTELGEAHSGRLLLLPTQPGERHPPAEPGSRPPGAATVGSAGGPSAARSSR